MKLPGRLVAFDKVCRGVPAQVISRVWDEATRGTAVGLCLHRVNHRVRSTDPLPELTVSPTVLDDLLGLVRGPGRARTPLMLSFDDGYADAVDYVDTRAGDWPDVEWVLFVCPQKLEQRAGFRWDLMETLHERHLARRQMVAYLDHELDLFRENERPDLRALVDRPEFRMVSADRLREIRRRHPNVALGNHSDHHFRFTRLGSAGAREEMEGSRRRFDALFGPTRHFAFPFGVPRRDFAPVDALRAHETGHPATWSTEPRAYRPAERAAGVILPRIPILGGLGPKTLALWIARMALRRRGGDLRWSAGRLVARLGRDAPRLRWILRD